MWGITHVHRLGPGTCMKHMTPAGGSEASGAQHHSTQNRSTTPLHPQR